MRWIYISPHLDDAILSCGGLIHKQVDSGTVVDIWTICAGNPPDGALSPFATNQHNSFSNANHYYRTRRNEDMAACQRIGARHRHLPFKDCIYRKSVDGKWLYETEETIFGDLLIEDGILVQDIKNFLKLIIRPTDQLVSPLAIGNHVDHQLVRTALEEMDRPIKYYADVPYTMRANEELLELSNELKVETHDLSRNNISAWKESICAYTSQVNTLFGNIEKMNRFIDEFSISHSGIPLLNQI
ncbi:PIG-L deacetylase family protein [Chloroflexota bacterium]